MSLVGTLNSGVSALNTFSQSIQVISNNIANVNTTGFKTSRAGYADGFSNLLQQAAPSVASGVGSNVPSVQIGTGVQLASVTANFSQGTLTSTGSNTDLGVSGNGFFRVRDTTNNIDYVSRSGDFRLDDQGYLVTSEGFRVQGLSDGAATYDATDVGGVLTYTKTTTAPVTVGDVKIDFNIAIGTGLTNSTGGTFTDAQVTASKPTMRSFTVDQLGNVVIGLSNGDAFVRGRVMLQNFNDPNALTKEGKNLFSGLEAAGPISGVNLTEATNSPGTNGLGRIEIGTLELSNVDLSQEFADMIVVQRSFQAGSRVITVSDSMLEEVINLKR
ncbi:MAG: flagellar hook-basal body complex protein [Chthoniobacter sp.]|nr:flagellar hook-basal body complex protein [Chthoniobacter sp.]